MIRDDARRRQLLRAWLVAGAFLVVAEAQREDFPCGHHEWIRASWRPGMPVECTSCYVCSIGQECLQRGGCFNCTDGEVDRDSDPLTPCTQCPEGKIPEPSRTRCSDPSLLDKLGDKLTEMIVGSVGSVVSVILVYCGCKKKEGSDAKTTLDKPSVFQKAKACCFMRSWRNSCCCCGRVTPPGKTRLLGELNIFCLSTEGQQCSIMTALHNNPPGKGS